MRSSQNNSLDASFFLVEKRILFWLKLLSKCHTHTYTNLTLSYSMRHNKFMLFSNDFIWFQTTGNVNGTWINNNFHPRGFRRFEHFPVEMILNCFRAVCESNTYFLGQHSTVKLFYCLLLLLLLLRLDFPFRCGDVESTHLTFISTESNCVKITSDTYQHCTCAHMYTNVSTCETTTVTRASLISL